MKTIAIIVALNTKGDEDVTSAEVAHQGGVELRELRGSADKARAMATMTRGAAMVAAQLHAAQRIDAMIGIGGSAGTDALSLDKAPAVVQAIADAAKRIKRDVLLLCHGGPIATPEDAAYVLSRCDAQGFVGASSMERLPVETAIATTTRAFKSISPGRRTDS